MGRRPPGKSMAIIVTARSNSGEAFGSVPYYGLNFMDQPQNGWSVVQTGPNEFVVHVFYANAISFYPRMITFRSETGFTYTPDSPFPTGVVSWIGTGFPGDGPGNPPVPDQYFSISAIAGLGLTVGEIVADPERLLAGDDTITGGSASFPIFNSDEIYAGDGNDTIRGASTDGWYDLGRGDGWLNAGAGVDFARFDLSDRTGAVIYTHNNTQAVAAIDGITVVTVRNVERVEVVGGSGYDRITGGSGNDVINLGLGGGFADGGDGEDGDGIDRVILDFSNESRAITYVHDRDLAQAYGGGVALAEVRTIEEVNIVGGAGNDAMTGWAYDDRLVGGTGDDVLNGEGGSDVLIGGAGNDRLEGGVGYDYIQLSVAGTVNLRLTGAQNYGEGWDTLSGIEGVFGSEGADHLIGTDETNTLRGRGGDDVIEGGGGNDVLTGGRGHNILWGGDGDDNLNGYDSGSNILTLRDPSQGSNEIHGGAGNDIAFGANGDDVMYGDDGNDQLWGWGGQAELYGGAGDDIVVGGDVNDWLEGGAGNDTLRGEFGDNTLIGAEGNDVLSVRGGNNRLEGGEGDDKIQGSWGNDIMVDAGGDDDMDGGGGFDIVDYSGAHAGVNVITYVGWDIYTGNWGRQDTGGSGSDLLINIYGVIGSRFDDRLTGRNDAWAAGEGYVFAEYFDGGEGNDWVDAGSGDDQVYGGAGDDVIRGGAGHDRIDGGAGIDVVDISGTGANYSLFFDGDAFVLKSADGRDRLTGVEFVRFADGDVLDLMRVYEEGGSWRSPDAEGAAAWGKDAYGPLVLPSLADKHAGEPLVLPDLGHEPRWTLSTDLRIIHGPMGPMLLDPDIGLPVFDPWG